MKRGEPISKAATETLERYRSLLFSIAFRMLGSVMEAEDVVQEASYAGRRHPGERSTRPSLTSRLSLSDSR